MPNDATLRMLKKYEDKAPPQLFLSSLFQTPPENYHDSEKVAIDYVRNDPRIAIPLPSGHTDARRVERTKWQDKEYTPAVFDTAVSIGSFNGFKRRAGEDPFDPNAGMLKNIVSETMESVRYIDGMTRRGVELQCAQVLTTGIISSVDSTNTVVYSCDFSMRAAHLVTVGTNWAADGTAGDPEGDISAIAEVIRRNGKLDVNQVIAGRLAIQRLLANTKIRANLNLWNANFGKIETAQKRAGATFHGVIQLGTEMLELWSYKETYLHPNTGAHTPFLPDNKVIVRASAGRLDITYGSIPTIVPPDSRVAQFMPSRLSDPTTGLDVSINGYVTQDNKHLTVEVGTRALAIPTAIDTYGCLTVF